jgi:threonyl-tRNA synthetase
MLVCLRRRGLSLLRQRPPRPFPPLPRPRSSPPRVASLRPLSAAAMGENSAAAAGKGKEAKGKATTSASASAPNVEPDVAYLEAVTQKRIRQFEEIQAKQALERLNIGGEPIRITLPDGAVKDGKKWISTPMDIAKEISSGLANSCLIAQVNGTLWDMTRPLEGDCELKLFKFDSNEGRDTFWHSSAHILGESLERAYGCKLCIGPCTTRGEVLN